MGSFRITTNGVLRNYRTNLYKSYGKLNDAMTRVQTQRNFNSYAEDPASASLSFQLRRSISRTDAQIVNNEHLSYVYNSAWSTLESIADADPGSGSDTSFSGIREALAGITDTAGGGRVSLGKALIAKSDSIVHMMNVKYGDHFVFGGADALELPFQWGTDGSGNEILLYRGVDVSAVSGSPDYLKLEAMAEEKIYVDIGLGLEDDGLGGIVDSSAFNSALPGVAVLGYGTDADGYSKNLPVLLRQLGEIFAACDPDSGAYANAGDGEKAQELMGKLFDAMDYVAEEHSQLDVEAAALDTNLTQLQDKRLNLEEQRALVEEMDPAQAITEMTWAQYCYNAALKIGNNILSQSLIDYMN